MSRVSLIIEGGGMRGLFSAGVLDFFIQRNLYFNNVYGVSAGACHGLSYISKQFDRARRVNINYVKNPGYSGIAAFLREGTFFGFDYIFNKIPRREPIDWYNFFNNQNPERKFYITVTDSQTGTPGYFSPSTPEEAIQWLRASSSLPIIGKPVRYKGRIWFDGGISDSIPLEKAESQGHTKHVIILTREKGYVKPPLSKTEKRLLKLLYSKYPALISASENRHIKYNGTLEKIARLEAEGRAFVYRPSGEIPVGRLTKNVKKLESLYREGYEQACSKEKNLKNFLEQNNGALQN